MSEAGKTHHLTLDRKHPDFEKYIWGDFSQSERALPVQSLNVNSDREQVTFEIRKIQDIQRPSLWEVAVTIFKVKYLVLVLFPLFMVLFLNLAARVEVSSVLALCSALGAMCLMIAVNLANDVQDHIRGLDRILPHAGGIAIQRGWLTAKQLYAIAIRFSVVGVLLGLPSSYYHPEILWAILPLASVGLVSLLSNKAGLKYRAWSEWVVFFMVGPLLTVGYQLSFGGGFDFQVLFLGILTGWLGVFLLHLRNWNHLLVNSQANFDNTVARFGFEKSRKFIIYWWIGFVFLLVVYHAIFSGEPWLWMIAVFSTLVSLPFIGAMSDVDSPLGSGIHRAVFVGHRVVMFVGAMWFLEGLWLYFLTDFF